MERNKTLLIVINVDWLFVMHRMAIAKGAQMNGFKVIVAAKDTGKAKDIRKAGMQFVDIAISRSGINPYSEIKAMFTLYLLYKKLNPTVVYHVTMKPVIYGTLIAKILKIPSVNGISGLGYNFTDSRRNLVQKSMISLMKLGFNKEENHLIFENFDDYKELQDLGIVKYQNTINRVKGVGVDLELYKNIKRRKEEKLIILLPTRMLWDKGVKEFVDASLLLKNKYAGKVIFKLCGGLDYDNKEAVPKDYLEKLVIKGYLEWIGHQENMVSIYAESDIVVLPSYREGMPTVLLEACSMGLPIVTTDTIGCKECVEEGLNGYKVPVKSVKYLAEAIEKLINSTIKREQMGLYSRKKAEIEFNQKDVVYQHVTIFENTADAINITNEIEKNISI